MTDLTGYKRTTRACPNCPGQLYEKRLATEISVACDMCDGVFVRALRGRTPIGAKAMTQAERQSRRRALFLASVAGQVEGAKAHLQNAIRRSPRVTGGTEFEADVLAAIDSLCKLQQRLY